MGELGFEAIQLDSLSTRGAVQAKQRGTRYQGFGEMYTKGLCVWKMRSRQNHSININTVRLPALDHSTSNRTFRFPLSNFLPSPQFILKGNTARFCFVKRLGKSYLNSLPFLPGNFNSDSTRGQLSSTANLLSTEDSVIQPPQMHIKT